MPQDALQTHTVDGQAYQFSYLAPRQALALWSRLAVHVIPAMASALPKGKGLAAELSELNLEGAAQHLVSLLAQEQFAKDVDLLLATVLKDDNSPVTVDLYPGRTMHILKLVAKALEVNYADFFAAFKTAIAAIRAEFMAKKVKKAEQADQP